MKRATKKSVKKATKKVSKKVTKKVTKKSVKKTAAKAVSKSVKKISRGSTQKQAPKKTSTQKQKVHSVNKTLSAAKTQLGSHVPDFSLPNAMGQTVSLSSLKGKNVVLFFYPKDMTPGCTLEGKDFSRLKSEFENANTVIFGISRDSTKSHQKFIEKECFTIDLLSDEAEEGCELFGVIKEKNMYGKKVMGIERSTFLIDSEGVLRKEWRGVKVDGHADEVLAAVRAL